MENMAVDINHTIPGAASWNSDREGGFLDWNSEGMHLEFQMGGGGGGGFSSEFPEWEDGKSFN